MSRNRDPGQARNALRGCHQLLATGTKRNPQPRGTLRGNAWQSASRQLGRNQPATVWTCAQNDLVEGTGLITAWLLAAVVKIVTTYSRPGQRVLLVEPPPGTTRSTRRLSAALRTRPLRNPYGGLLEAAWTVTRLGRSIQTRTAGPPPDLVDHAQIDQWIGPGPAGPERDNRWGQPSDCQPGPGVTTIGPEPHPVDLIITAAEPQALDGLRPADWADRLDLGGTLTVITHGDQSPGRFTDPAGPLVHAAHRAGLYYRDRITLLRTPLLGAVHIGLPSRSRTPHEHATAPVPHIQAHADLFVFTRRPDPIDINGGKETSDA